MTNLLTDEKLQNLLEEISAFENEPTHNEWKTLMRKFPKPEGGFYSKSEVLERYKLYCVESGEKFDTGVQRKIRMKPTRTISGVTPVTIFTNDQSCSGRCIFCPTQPGVPKSYLKEEPGIQRAETVDYDPYDQVKIRLQAFENIGHNTDKIEVIVSGGTWSFYPKGYREWFIKQTFKALNNLPKEDESSFEELHKLNETANHRCIGLSVETRPDNITNEELHHLRSMGVTKIQIGVQSMNDEILKKNVRGHNVETTRKAINMMRLWGFKVQIHWMANLYGATPESDYEDFQKLWSDISIRPDEMKVYPCSVIKGTPLYMLMRQGKHVPYTEKELTDLLVKCKPHIEYYCRITRLIRDIPSQLISGGTKTTNLRQVILKQLEAEGKSCRCIRCNEIRSSQSKLDDMELVVKDYETKASKEYFLHYVTNDTNKLAGFLRLSIPNKKLSNSHYLEELRNTAIIREVHIYGRAVKIDSKGETQHIGLGKLLLEKAKEITGDNSYKKLSVISGIGTREYYRKQGFKDGKLYQFIDSV